MPEISFYGLNALISVAMALLCWVGLPKNKRGSSLIFVSSVTVFCFFLPGIGEIIVLFLAFTVWLYSSKKETAPISFVSQPSQTIHGIHVSKFGNGGVAERLFSNTATMQLRTEALLALSTLQSAEKNALVRQTLSDDTDQIRLLAFSLLDKQEKKISAQITALRNQIEQTLDQNKIRQLSKQCALQYWELIYNDLVQGDLRQSVLKLALDYANKSLDETNPDLEIVVLLSKLYTACGDLKHAEESLAYAKAKGVKGTHVLPYLAAISFDKRDFVSLRKYLTESPNLADVPKLNQVMQFWCAP